jgi:hypothetical protein
MSEATFRCRQCLDDPSGWISLHCEGARCGLVITHAPHGFAVKCPCWLTRNAELLQRNAQTALSKGRKPSALYEQLTDAQAGRYKWAHVVTMQTRG